MKASLVALGLAVAVSATAVASTASAKFVVVEGKGFKLDATVTASATKADGVTPDATKTKYVNRYVGPAGFTFTYTVNIEDDVFKAEGSSITFDTTYFTYTPGTKPMKVSKGEAGFVPFTTKPIPISLAAYDKDNSILSLSFEGPWYPDADVKKYALVDLGLSGMIDLVTGEATFTSKYQDGEGGPISTFVTKGKLAGAAPEPGTWALMLAGFGLAGTALRRRQTRLAS